MLIEHAIQCRRQIGYWQLTQPVTIERRQAKAQSGIAKRI